MVHEPLSFDASKGLSPSLAKEFQESARDIWKGASRVQFAELAGEFDMSKRRSRGIEASVVGRVNRK
jgi:hypothetical protein